MNESEITTLAREYAEETVNMRHTTAIVADDAEHVIRFLLRRFCLVEKSELEDALMHISNMISNDEEPKPAEPTRKEAKENENTFAFDNPTATKSDSFRNHNRLHIAAMAMQGILSNADRMKQYGEIAMRESDSLTQLVARNALRFADALIAECEKGGEGND